METIDLLVVLKSLDDWAQTGQPHFAGPQANNSFFPSTSTSPRMTAAKSANLERLDFGDDGCSGMIPGPVSKIHLWILTPS